MQPVPESREAPYPQRQVRRAMSTLPKGSNGSLRNQKMGIQTSQEGCFGWLATCRLL